MKEQIEKVMSMMGPDFDWHHYWEEDMGEGLDEEFRQCITLEFDEEEAKGKYYECGSWRSPDTPRGLYRLLYLCKPKEVDFSDMYKIPLFFIFSKDMKFSVTVYLFKYELGLYFSCPRNVIEGQGSGIRAGAPGSDNGWHCTDPVGNAFFDMIMKITEFEHTVYSGNNFIV